MNEVRIITATGMFGASASDDLLDTAMRVIGVGFSEPEEWSSKYGTDYENDVFMMHRFCWCERDDCPWCMGCDCPEESQRFFVDGTEVPYKEWMAFFDREAGSRDNHDEWVKRADAANLRRTERHDPVCDFCTTGRFLDKGASKGRAAPHFLFKPSGFRLWWYKYIGRDMETDGTLPGDFLHRVFATHPKGMTVERALAELARREGESAKSLAEMFASLGVETK